jgi:ubiquinone biosynthesis protein COQ4
MLSPSLSEPNTRLRPLKALGAVRRLLRDPDDTRQVFIVLQALRGRSGQRSFRRFRATTEGRAILSERRTLLPYLQDRQALARLPQGLLGRTYLDFMTVENLTADGLVEASASPERDAAPEDVRLFQNRTRDMHDLTHVITSYGRDPLGELCLLAFNHAQSSQLGVALIVLMGMTRLGHGPRGRAARAAVVQAWRNGRTAAWLSGQDWEAMLVEPMESLRNRLRIAEPTRYRAVMS